MARRKGKSNHPFLLLGFYFFRVTVYTHDLFTPRAAVLSTQVIRYQKQLQQNYIQMYRRNRDLERVTRELSLELENRDVVDYEVRSGSNDIHFEEITATEI